MIGVTLTAARCRNERVAVAVRPAPVHVWPVGPEHFAGGEK